MTTLPKEVLSKLPAPEFENANSNLIKGTEQVLLRICYENVIRNKIPYTANNGDHTDRNFIFGKLRCDSRRQKSFSTPSTHFDASASRNRMINTRIVQ